MKFVVLDKNNYGWKPVDFDVRYSYDTSYGYSYITEVEYEHFMILGGYYQYGVAELLGIMTTTRLLNEPIPDDLIRTALDKLDPVIFADMCLYNIEMKVGDYEKYFNMANTVRVKNKCIEIWPKIPTPLVVDAIQRYGIKRVNTRSVCSKKGLPLAITSVLISRGDVDLGIKFAYRYDTVGDIDKKVILRAIERSQKVINSTAMLFYLWWMREYRGGIPDWYPPKGTAYKRVSTHKYFRLRW